MYAFCSDSKTIAYGITVAQWVLNIKFRFGISSVIIYVAFCGEANISCLLVTNMDDGIFGVRKKRSFDVPICFPCFMVIQVVAGKIGDYGGFKFQSVQTVLGNCMRGSLHNNGRNATIFHFAKQGIQNVRRRCCICGIQQRIW